MTLKLSARIAACAALLASTALPLAAQEPTPTETPAAEAPATPAPPAETPETGSPAAETPAAEAPAAAAAPDPGTVVARVGQSEITEGDLAAAAADLGPQFQQLPPEQRRIAVLAALIDIRSLSQKAQEAGLEDDPLVQRRMAFLRDRALHNAFFETNGVEAITEEELRARYEAEVAATEPVEEVHARHILVPTREEAEEVIAELDAGAEFETVAAARSTGPTGPQGGDLGFFGPGQMVPAFEQAAYALEPGTYTKEPVETQFGWHVIEVLEKRTAEPPPFEAVREQVRQLVMREKYIEMVQDARESLTVDYVDPTVEAQIQAMEAAMSGAAAGGEGAASGAAEPAASEPEAAMDEADEEADPAPNETETPAEAPAADPAEAPGAEAPAAQ